MVRTTLLLALVATTAACDVDRYEQPIAITPHGDAFRHNMRAQIIDPTPPQRSRQIYGAQRRILALEAYRNDEVKDPTAQKTAPDTTSEN